MMTWLKLNPKGSNFYRIMKVREYSTPSGSHLSPHYSVYKYGNPSDCELLNHLKAAVK